MGVTISRMTSKKRIDVNRVNENIGFEMYLGITNPFWDT
jgi:hypothetical protein